MGVSKISCRCYLKQGAGLYSDRPFSDPVNVLYALKNMMRQLDREMFLVVHLNKDMAPKSFHICSIGTINASLISPHEIFKAAILDEADYILLLHNHPSGDPTPSDADLQITKRIVEAGRFWRVPVVDHIVVGDGIGHKELASVRADYGQVWSMPKLMEASHGLREVVVRIKPSEKAGIRAHNPEYAARSMVPDIGGIGKDQILVTAMSTKMELINAFRIPLDKAKRKDQIRQVLKGALLNNAACLMLFTGNWPDFPEPGLIGTWVNYGDLLQMPVVDCISLAADKYRSAREEGHLPQAKHLWKSREAEL